MSRYIDADVLLKELRKSCEYHAENSREFSLLQRDIIIVQEQPTIEAVPKEKILLFLNIANEELSKAHANKSANGIVTWSASVTTLEGLLKEYDTADTDIVPVTRCKDCKYRDEETANCTRFRKDWYVQSNSFCSWAERRGEE